MLSALHCQRGRFKAEWRDLPYWRDMSLDARREQRRDRICMAFDYAKEMAGRADHWNERFLLLVRLR